MNYLEDGYTIIENKTSENKINEIRVQVEKNYKKNNYDRDLFINELDNTKIKELIFNLLHSDKVIDEIQNISLKVFDEKDKLGIFPFFKIMRNFYSNVHQGYHGWHRDCGGEKNYKYSREKLSKEDYVFGKIGVYLQSNSGLGGAIDIIPKSHLSGRMVKNSVSDVPVRGGLFLITKICDLVKKLNKTNNHKIDWGKLMFGYKSLDVKPGEAVLFDSGILHRGSPISFKKQNSVSLSDDNYYEIFSNQDDYKGDVGIYNKYACYSQFGSQTAVEGYFFDRLKRPGYETELDSWFEQLKKIDDFPLKSTSLKILENVAKTVKNF